MPREYKRTLFGDKLQNTLDKLIAGVNRKQIEFEEKISQASISQIKTSHPLFFWNKEDDA